MTDPISEPAALSSANVVAAHADARFMALALALGRRGLGRTWPNPAVGALLVKDQIVVGRGWTQPGGRPHAEIEALRRAGPHSRQSMLYVTLEPCCHHGKSPPCTDAIVAAGVARVVSAMVDPNPQVAGAGHWQLAEQGVVVEVGIGGEEARRTHAGHLRVIQDGRPHVMLKLAVSADEKVALAGRRPAIITGEAASRRVHLMRARSDAVMTGIGTILADDPQLTCRLPGMPSSVRVVIDAGLRLPLTSKLVESARLAPVWVLTSAAAAATSGAKLAQRGVAVIELAEQGGKLDLRAALETLARRGITRVMVEAGPILATALLKSDLIDELALFRSPAVLGAGALDALDGFALSALTQSPSLKQVGRELVGADTLETFERA